jgi:hypothetical protein
VTYKAFERIAAGVNSTRVVTSVLPIAGPLAVDDRHERMSHSRYRRVHRLVAPAPAAQLLAAYRAAEAKLAVPWEYLAAIH